MLRRYRRYFALLAFGLLVTPLVVGMVMPDGPEAILKEGRYLAALPSAPATPDDWLGLPKETDAYLRDHFGLRQVLIRAHKDITRPLLGVGNDSVLIGRDGRMFYLGEETVRESAGLILRDRRVADQADMLQRMNEELRARGVRFLVAPPPNASTIYQDDLPHWAQNPGRPTEYDLFLADLAARGVPAVDLRPAVKQDRAVGPVFYMHDTHWTARGALAAYNAAVEADGRPDWRIESGAVLTPPVLRKGGDLARMFGVSDSVTEYAEDLTLPHGKKVPITTDILGDFIETGDKLGPTVLILGDSFTGLYFPPMLLTRAGRVIWMNHRLCGFDWNEVVKYRPDEVWWMPNERFLVCAPDKRPNGLPESKPDAADGEEPPRGFPRRLARPGIGMARESKRQTTVRSVLILGGARSGKSAYAQKLAEAHGPRRLYLATAAAGDEEMAARIARHRCDRGQGWTTLEEPLEVAAALATHAQDDRAMVVDCLTLWLSNLMLAGRDLGPEVAALAEAIPGLAGPAILVSNEVGMGLVPDNKLGREFRDWQGRANREIAAACDAVVFVAAGLPLQLKPAAALSVQLG